MLLILLYIILYTDIKFLSTACLDVKHLFLIIMVSISFISAYIL